MTVAELIEILNSMPQDLPIEINDNLSEQIIYIDSVDAFPDDEDYPVVMIQANVGDPGQCGNGLREAETDPSWTDHLNLVFGVIGVKNK